MSYELETAKLNEQVSKPVPVPEPEFETVPEPEVESVPTDSCQDDDHIEPLSGKPCFPITLLKSHVGYSCHMCQLRLPAQIIPMLPNNIVPITLTRGGRSWETTCGAGKIKKLDSRWRVFVEDNKLKVGDVCIFELMECSDTAVKFKVQILRGDFPSVLLDKENGTMKHPIVVD